MANKLSKIVSWVLYALLAVSALLTILFYTNNLDSASFIQWGIILVIAAAVIAIASPVYGFILSPGNIVKMLISIGIVAVIAVISYSLAGNTFSDLRLEVLGVTEQTSKWVGMGLLFTYITAALSILAIIYSNIMKIFK